MADELEQFATRRFVSVTVESALDGTGDWRMKVDYSDAMSPWDAKGLLQGGIEHIDWALDREGQGDR